MEPIESYLTLAKNMFHGKETSSLQYFSRKDPKNKWLMLRRTHQETKGEVKSLQEEAWVDGAHREF